MYTKHKRDNAKLRIFSFIPQRQRIQPNFMNHTYQTTKHTNTTQTTKTTTSTFVSPLTQSLSSYSWGNANSGVLIFKLRNKLANFVQFIHHQFVQFIILKNLFVAWWTISYISSIPTWIRNRLEATVKKNTWMRRTSVTFMVIISKLMFWKLLDFCYVQSSFSTITRHIDNGIWKILYSWRFYGHGNNIHANSLLGKYNEIKMGEGALKVISSQKSDPVLWRTLH